MLKQPLYPRFFGLEGVEREIQSAILRAEDMNDVPVVANIGVAKDICVFIQQEPTLQLLFRLVFVVGYATALEMKPSHLPIGDEVATTYKMK